MTDTPDKDPDKKTKDGKKDEDRPDKGPRQGGPGKPARRQTGRPARDPRKPGDERPRPGRPPQSGKPGTKPAPKPGTKPAPKPGPRPGGKPAPKGPAPKGSPPDERPPPAKAAGAPAKPSQPPAKPRPAKPEDAPKPPSPRPTEEPPATEDGDAPDKRSGSTDGTTRAAKPGEGPARSTRSAPDADTIAKQAAAGAIRPDVIKKPFFPPPVQERPKPLIDEERRRQRIVAAESKLRREEWETLSESERIRKQHEWQAQDALHYRAHPDDQELEVYPINEPFAYVQIIKNSQTKERLYHVIEPMLDRTEQLLLDFIEETMVDVLDLDPDELDGTEIEDYVEAKFDQVLYDYALLLTDGTEPQEGDEDYVAPVGDWEADENEDDVKWAPRTRQEEDARARLLYYVKRDFIGEGPIDVFMQDAMIEDISCDGPHVPVFIYHRQFESIPTTVHIRPHDKLDSFVIRMAQRAGKHVSVAEPILDATMRDGSRLQATLAKEVSSFGSTFTIRKFRDVPFTPIDLVRFGTMSPQILAYFWMLIQHGMSMIYAGGTASGKTTATNAIMVFIPPQLKVITIEDTREIQIPQQNWIAGVTRGGFGPHDEHGRQAGEIDMFQLLKNALRQRPEYVIVGEVRGAEAYNLFQAMATGHAAYGTMHADSVDAVIHRLESDPINIPRSLLEALDVVSVQMQTRVEGKRVRRTKQVTEVVGLDPNTREILTNEVFTWMPESDTFRYSGISYVLERIAVETGRTVQKVKDDLAERIKIIEWMIDHEVRDYDMIGELIAIFYRDRDRLMKHVTEDTPWRR